jgi:bla regulator protein blaR1
MKSSFWTPYIPDHTINAICWTLIHSLWIGLVIALLSGLVITITRKSSATFRYNLLCGILMLFTLSVCITFYLEMWTPATVQGPFHVGQFILAPDNHIMIIPATTAPHLSLFSRMVVLLNEYANIIFLVWLLLFVLKSLKMAGGLLYIQRIRNYKVHEVSEEFKHKIEMFSSQIGIRQTVRLVQSELVKVPVAVGWLKPVILLPMGILLQLSPEQLESILWHELAHIRRRDYLVNILQGLVETVFFFNPGLLWLSSLIRAEREACCDDMVLNRTNRKANYLEALLAFGNEDNSGMPLAMSIGSGNQLRDRLKRMIDKENKRLNMAEKVVLVAGLVILSAFTTMPKTTIRAAQNLVNVMINKPGKKNTLKIKTVSIDSVKKQPVTTFKTEVLSRETLHYKIDTAIRFRSVLFKRSDSDLTNNDISAMSTADIKYHFIVANGKLVAMDIDGKKVDENDLPKYEFIVRQIDDAVAAKRYFREQEHLYAKLRADGRFDKMRNDSMRFKPGAKFKAGQFKMSYVDSFKFKPGTKFKAGQFKMRNDSMRFKVNSKFKPVSMNEMHFKFDAMRQRWHDDSVSYSGQKNRALNVIADLVHDKAVPDPASVKWFGLSATEFIVNGQKQPDEMQQRYKAKYGIYKDYGLYFGPVEMHGTGVFIDADPLRPPLPPGSPRPLKEQYEPRSGYVGPKYVDTNAWKLRQLMKQQQNFAADYGNKQQQLFKMQQKWKAQIDEQHNFKAGINLKPAISGIIADLVNENVLKDKSDLIRFNLTNSELMVNGVKQSEALHEKLKAKYLQRPDYYKLNSDIFTDPNFGLHFNAQNGYQGLGVTSGPDSP